MKTRGDILLLDSDHDRTCVITAMLARHGFVVMTCRTADECLGYLGDPERSFRFLLISVDNTSRQLLSALMHRACEEMQPVPQLLLWSAHGEEDLREFHPFLARLRAPVFEVPLDVELLVRVAEALAT